MTLITRYLLREYFKIFSICLAAFLLAYLAIDFFEKVRKFAEHQAEISWVIRYFLLRLPRMIFEVTPLAALLSTLLTLGNLSRNSEFTALRSLGVGPAKILLPLLYFGIVTSLILLVLNLSVIPGGYKKAHRIREVQITKKPLQSDFVQDKVWTKFSPTTLSNIQLVDTAKNVLYGISIYRLNDDFTLPEILEAKEMRYEEGRWVLYSGIRRRFFEDGSMEENPFDQLPFSLKKEPKDFQRMQVKEDRMRYRELSRYVKRLESEGYVHPRYAVNLQNKIAYPFTTLVVLFLGVPFALKDGRSGGLARGIGICLVIGFLYWLTYASALAIGYGGGFHPILSAWLTHILFGAVALYLLMTVKW